jgi:glycosyltransferase involved in cell wall biosynthesis
MSLSLIVPSYNDLVCIRDLCKKLFELDSWFFEVIFVIDGSEDGTLEYLNRTLEDREDCVIVNLDHNQGLAQARLAGLKAANGDFVFFLDSDDWMDFNVLKKMYEISYSMSLDLCIADYQANLPSGESIRSGPLRSFDQRSLILSILKNEFIPFSWGKIFRKSTLLNLNFGTYKIAEDLYLMSQVLLTKNLNVFYVPQVVVFYRVRVNSWSRSINVDKLKSGHDATIASLSFFKQSIHDKREVFYLDFFYFNHCLHYWSLGLPRKYFRMENCGYKFHVNLFSLIFNLNVLKVLKFIYRRLLAWWFQVANAKIRASNNC